MHPRTRTTVWRLQVYFIGQETAGRIKQSQRHPCIFWIAAERSALTASTGVGHMQSHYPNLPVAHTAVPVTLRYVSL